MGPQGRPARLALLFAFLVVSCGTPPSSGPKSADKGAGPDSPAGKPTADPARSEAPAGPRKPSCSDGSCFECGEGICPTTGFYCETAGSAPPACAWAAPCAQKATCACLAPHTKGCSCQERGGVAHVTCGSLPAPALTRAPASAS